MPRGSTYTAQTILDVHATIANKSSEDIRADILACSIKRSSLNAYHSEVIKMISWARLCRLVEERNDPNFRPTVAEFTLFQPTTSKERDFKTLALEFRREDFFSFYYAHAQCHPFQFGRMRAALRLAQMMAGVEIWACWEEFKTAEKGATHKAANNSTYGTRLRGTLSNDMLDNLISWVRERNAFMADAMAIQVGACLRISELIKLAPHHITADGVLITNQKRDTVASMSSGRFRTTLKPLTKWTGGRDALSWLNEAAATNRGYPLLFPRFRFSQKEYNATIQEGATALNFPRDLLYDGSHILRHTGVGRAARELIQSMNLADAAKTLLMSVSMVVHYSRSIEDRLQKRRVPAFLSPLLRNPSAIAPREDSEDSEDSDEDTTHLQEHIVPLRIGTTRPRSPTTTTRGSTGTRRRETTRRVATRPNSPATATRGVTGARRRETSRSEVSEESERPTTGLSHLSPAERNARRDANGELRRAGAAADAEKRRLSREASKTARLRRASQIV